MSVTIYDLCVRQGLWVPFSMARGIAGACLLIPENPYNGWGPAGHIGFSDGRGGTVEATPPRVQRLPIGYQNWGTNACLLPGIDYSNAGMGGGGDTIDKLMKEIEMFLVRNTDLPMDAPNNWFLVSSMGVTPNIPHDRVYNMAAFQKFEAKAMSGGEIFALAVDLGKQRDDLIRGMKEQGVGGTTVVEKPIAVPMDITTVTNEQLGAELVRRMSNN